MYRGNWLNRTHRLQHVGYNSEHFWKLYSLQSTTKCGHCTAVLKYFDRLLILTSPTIHYDACQCNFATDFFSRIFRQNEQRRYLRVGFVLCRALSCGFLGSELARFPASGRPPPPPCLLYIYTPEHNFKILEGGKHCFSLHNSTSSSDYMQLQSWQLVCLISFFSEVALSLFISMQMR